MATETASDSRPLDWKQRLLVIVVLAAVMWLIQVLNSLVWGGGLSLRYGIHPRTTSGLFGIVFAPFLHGGYLHLLSNTVPFLVLGSLVAVRGMGQFVTASVLIVIGGGLGTWLTGGAYTVHVGASGVIFGYFGFLVLAGLLEKEPGSLLVSVVVGMLYGGMIWGVLPTVPHVSWQGHLFGFLAGLGTARLFASKRR
jgi:membrane associated rhomboid family serine protease